MKALFRCTSSLRINGEHTLRIIDIVQNDNEQWFSRTTDNGKVSAWQASEVELLKEVHKNFWAIRLNSKPLSELSVYLPSAIWPKYRLPK